jgi:hypothetical protein
VISYAVVINVCIKTANHLYCKKIGELD